MEQGKGDLFHARSLGHTYSHKNDSPTIVNHSGNFRFLAEHSLRVAQLGAAAENVFAADPNTTLIKLRQFGEAMVQHDTSAQLSSKLGR